MRLSLLLLAALPLLAQGNRYRAARHGGTYMFNYYLPPAPSATPWAPAWSPDGRYLAVGMHGSLWRVDAQTGEAVELTYGRSYHSSPAWSPDGRWIVYTADHEGRSIGLEILNLSSGETRTLTSDEHLYLDPVFSPDGSRLAYVSTRPSGFFNIYVRELRDGRWAGEEIALTSDHRYPRDRLYFGPWDMYTQPTWTTDGKEILLVSNRGVPLGSGHLWRMPAEAGGFGKARPIREEQTLYRTRPHVSPDGKRVIYSSTAGAADQYNHLYLIPLTGGTPYKLTFGAWDDFHPRWSPDGEWIAYITNQGGLPRLCLLETYGGARRIVPMEKLARKRPVGRLEVQVLDEHGQPTPARVHLTASDGKFYPPADAYARIGAGGRHSFHTEGQSAVELPPGQVSVEAIKGFEYVPAAGEARITAGGQANVTLRLKRLADFGARGWWSGSTHTHMNYGGNLRNTLANMVLMSRAEGQHVLNVLVANKDNRVLDWQYFVPGGAEHPASTPDVKVIVGEEYRPPFWGHVFYLGLKTHLISPFTTGYEGTAIESLYPSNTDMFRKAMAQGAVTGYVHPFSGERDPLAGDLGVAKAFPVDAALRAVHALEWSAAGRAQLAVWHHALNLDLPIVPTGGEDSISNLHIGKLVGTVRTYAHSGSTPAAQPWLDALRAGRTFFTTGPLLEFQVEGRLPGDSLRLPAGGGGITLEGRAVSLAPVTRLVIYHNGSVLKELSPNTPFREQVQVRESGWYSLYAEGPAHPQLDAAFAQAATNAVRVYVGDGKIRNRASAEYFLRWMDKLRSMTEAWPWWRSESEKSRIRAQLDQATAFYRSLAQ